MKNNIYSLSASIWLYPGDAAWHFMSIPSDLSGELDFRYAHLKRGWGSLKVQVILGKSTWQTSIFPDKKTNTYLLPLKKAIRDAEQLQLNDQVKFSIQILE